MTDRTGDPARPEELASSAVPSEVVPDDEPGAEPSDDPWDEFIEWCRLFYESDSFEEEEIVYKLEIGEKLQAARDAVSSGSGDWLALLKRAFRKSDNLIHYMVAAKFLDWADDDPQRAVALVAQLWDSGQPIGERLAMFEEAASGTSFSSDGEGAQVVSFLLMVDPESSPMYRPSAYKGAVQVTGFDRFPDKTGIAATYLHAVSFVDEVLDRARERGLELRHRLDAQSVLFSVMKGSPDGASAEMVEDLKRYRGELRTVWWVNQGLNYEAERDAGIVTAGLKDRGGRTPRHWLNVSLLKKGDLVLHYAGSAIKAISKVKKLPRIAEPPTRPGEGPSHVGYLRYWELDEPFPLNEIPEPVRKEGGAAFNHKGGVNQGYLYPISGELETYLRRDLADRWPVSSPWEGHTVNHWIFQGNPTVWDMDEFLEEIDRGYETNWVVSRYRNELRIGDRVGMWKSGPDAGLYALATVTGEVYASTFNDEDTDLIDLVIDEVLTDRVLREELKNHPVLRDLSVIRQPQGTNFKVTADQWELLMSMVGDVNKPPGVVIPSFGEIAERIRDAGMVVDDRVLRRYHHALSTRRFVILSGVSGTGKTWLAQLYAAAVGAEAKLIAVAPNWVANEDLLGFYNPIDKTFHATDFTTFLDRAAAEHESALKSGRDARPFHVILDEMNLARVEYYFARFLSAMEIVARDGVARVDLDHELSIQIYNNLYFVGTVNVDETTHGFADKVYDRAQLIELTANRTVLSGHVADEEWSEAIMGIWDAVAGVKPFAFRVLDEIAAYIDHASVDDVPWEEALDDQILHKVLPKLAGGDDKLRIALEQVHERTNGTFPYSAAKAKRMLDDLRDHGFTSYF